MTTDDTVPMTRVRWRGSWWLEQTASRVRYFERSTDAEARVVKLKAKGYVVEVSEAKRSPWCIVHGGLT